MTVMVLAQAPFNADFYVAAATVIPVLFIPLLFPGGILHTYGVWAKKWRTRGAVKAYRAGDAKGQKRYLQGYKLLMLPIDAVLILGTFGEVCAFLALYHRHATHTEQIWVRNAVIVLPIAIANFVVASISVTYSTDKSFHSEVADDDEGEAT
jgi:hypothetical protein